MDNAPYISSMKDIYKHIEIWRINHAVEIYKILQGIIPEMESEELPDIPDEDDLPESNGEDSDNESDWMRIFNESFDNLSLDSNMLIDYDESMDVEEYNLPSQTTMPASND